MILKYFLLPPVLFFASTCCGQNFHTLDSVAQDLVDNSKVKGIAVVGINDGKIIYTKGFGYANEKDKMNNKTRLYIASNTKAFTGLAMAQLIDKKLIRLADPISKYIDRKYFPDSIAVDSITLRQLLSHTHGLSNDPLIFRTAYSGDHPTDLQKLLKFTAYRKGKLNHDFRYSNLGYLLAGIIIENVTGQSWKDYLHDKIFVKLGMANTMADLPVNGQIALPYRFADESLKLQKTENTLHAAGGLFTTTADMAKWLSFLTSARQASQSSLLNKYLLQLYETKLGDADQSMGPFELTAYSFGWINGTFDKNAIRLHFGSFPGYESMMSYRPDQQDAFFVFVNEKEAGLRIAGMLTAIYYSSLQQNGNPQMYASSFSPVIKKMQDSYKPFEAGAWNSDSLDVMPGRYVSEAYGILNIKKIGDHFNFELGELKSTGYKGKEENEILTEWIPGIIEHFYWEKEKNGFRYDDFGFFFRQ